MQYKSGKTDQIKQTVFEISLSAIPHQRDLSWLVLDLDPYLSSEGSLSHCILLWETTVDLSEFSFQ